MESYSLCFFCMSFYTHSTVTIICSFLFITVEFSQNIFKFVFYFCNLSLMGIWAVSLILSLIIPSKTLMIIHISICVGLCTIISLGWVQSSKMIGSCGRYPVNTLRNLSFLMWLYNFRFPATVFGNWIFYILSITCWTWDGQKFQSEPLEYKCPVTPWN